MGATAEGKEVRMGLQTTEAVLRLVTCLPVTIFDSLLNVYGAQ
jgi:hypothetical protein